jgi:hypothetical protein
MVEPLWQGCSGMAFMALEEARLEKAQDQMDEV